MDHFRINKNVRSFFAMMSIGILILRSLPDAYDCPNCKTRLTAKEWRKLVGTAKSDGFWN